MDTSVVLLLLINNFIIGIIHHYVALLVLLLLFHFQSLQHQVLRLQHQLQFVQVAQAHSTCLAQIHHILALPGQVVQD